MGLRLQNNHYDIDGRKHTINLYDSTYSMGVVPFDVEQPGIIKTYTPNTQERNFTILSSSIKFRMLIDGATIQSFVNDFIGAPEQRFRVVHLIDDVVEWVGLVLTDLVVIEDNYDPYLFEIEATDGLAKLKDVDYDNAGTVYSGIESIKDHLFNCLNKIGTLDLFSGDVLKSVLNWFSDGHASTSISVIEQTRVNHKTFIDVDNSGELEVKNCYEVIDELLKPFFCHLKLTNGAFFIFQTPEYEATNFTVQKYNSAGTSTGADLLQSFVKIDETDVDRAFGTTFQFYPALDRAEVKYKHYTAQSIIGPSDIDFVTYTGDIIDSGGGTSTLLFFFRYTYNADYDGLGDYVPVRTKIKLQIKIGSYYLERSSSIDASGIVSYGVTSWTTSPAFFEIFTDAALDDNVTINRAFSDFITPPIPADGVIEIITALDLHYNLNGEEITTFDYIFTVDIFDSYMEVITAGNIENRYNQVIHGADNSQSNNSKRLTVPTLIGDGPSGNTIGHLSVYNGTSWNVSNYWAKGALGSSSKIGQLLADQLILTQAKPIRIITGEVLGNYTPLYSLQYDSKKYVFHSGTFESANNKWSGRWFVIDSTGAVRVEKTPKSTFEIFEERLGLRTPIIVTQPDKFPDEQAQPAQIEVRKTHIPVSTTDAISSGDTITTIQIAEPGENEVLKAGDVITIINHVTGDSETFEVASDVGASDTTLSVTSKTAVNSYEAGAYITLEQKEILQKINNVAAIAKTRYKQEFSGQTGTSVTITKNGGVLPASDDDIDVLYNGTELNSADWSKSGSDINFTFTLNGFVTVKFLA